MILVVTGWNFNSHGHTQRFDNSQILDIRNSSNTTPCKDLKSYPSPMSESTGSLVEGSPIMCGGQGESKNCYIYDNSKNIWNHLANFQGIGRYLAASVSLNGALFVTGKDGVLAQ